MCIGEESKVKKESKHSSAHKLLESLYKYYLFSVQKEPNINSKHLWKMTQKKSYYIPGLEV